MPTEPNRVLAVLVGAVVLLAVVAGIVVANRATPALDPGSPEAVVQEYLEAVLDGDFQAASRLVAPSSGCNASDLALAYVPESSRIVLTDTAVDGDLAVVTLNVTEGAGDGPFGGEGYTRPERVTVERGDGVWTITDSPWLLNACDSARG